MSWHGMSWHALLVCQSMDQSSPLPSLHTMHAGGVWRLVWSQQAPNASALQKWGAQQANSFQVRERSLGMHACSRCNGGTHISSCPGMPGCLRLPERRPTPHRMCTSQRRIQMCSHHSVCIIICYIMTMIVLKSVLTGCLGLGPSHRAPVHAHAFNCLCMHAWCGKRYCPLSVLDQSPASHATTCVPWHHRPCRSSMPWVVAYATSCSSAAGPASALTQPVRPSATAGERAFKYVCMCMCMCMP